MRKSGKPDLRARRSNPDLSARDCFVALRAPRNDGACNA
jgi:hypothetical protein